MFCPEDGGPYVIKPRFFGTRADWEEFAEHDGFYVEQRDGVRTVLGRFGGLDFEASIEDGDVQFSGPDFAVSFTRTDPAGTIDGEATDEVDLTFFHLMEMIGGAVLEGGENYVSALAAR